jgi:hypothetical protein
MGSPSRWDGLARMAHSGDVFSSTSIFSDPHVQPWHTPNIPQDKTIPSLGVVGVTRIGSLAYREGMGRAGGDGGVLPAQLISC